MLPPAPGGGELTPSMVYIEPIERSAPTLPSEMLVKYGQLLRQHLWLLFILAAVGALASVALTYLETPIYEARTLIEIQGMPDRDSTMRFSDSGGADYTAFTAEYYIDTQVKILQSRSIRDLTLKKLASEGRQWTPPRNRFAELASKVGMRWEVAASNDADKQFRPEAKLAVATPPNTRLIEILCESPDSEYAADYANTLTHEYVDAELSARWDAAQHATEWLTQQLSELKNRLEQSETALRSYDQVSGILLSPDKRDPGDERLNMLQTEFTQAQSERITKQAVFELASSSTKDSLPDVLDNPRLNAYRLKLTELRQQLAELSSQLTPEHYKVKQVQAQINEVEAAQAHEENDILDRIREEYKAADRREKLLQAMFGEQTKAANQRATSMVGHELRQHEVDSLRQLYDELLRKVKEAGVASAASASSVRIVDAAIPPIKPTTPDPIRNLAACTVSGLLLGFTIVLGKGWIKQRLSSPGETPMFLGVPELGIIPEDDSVLGRRKRNGLITLDGDLAAEPLSGRGPLIKLDKQSSILAESFRNTLASILTSGPAADVPRVILATSPARGNGKSTAIANLALALAEVRPNIVLVDADLRKPNLHNLFEIPNDWGLSDLMRARTNLNDMPVEALARRTKIPGLHILTSGPGAASISGLLYSKRMAELILRLEQQFDTVLIDAPPLLAVADTRILGQYVDGAILIIQAGRTTRDEARLAVAQLQNSGIHLIGTILNRCDPKSAAAYGYAAYYSDVAAPV
jgi:succinoglycan biosynthesis transport protein ExoP